MDKIKIGDIEKIIGYKFASKNIIELAFTHSSYSNEMKYDKYENNERLEFLGDAVLELVTSEHLFRTYEKKQEGQLTRLRASIVCEPTLAGFARDINLGEYLLLGKGESQNGGRDRDSILANTVEAVIGAIYIDGGYKAAQEFVSDKLLKDIEEKQLFVDSKTYLQEKLQSYATGKIDYEVVDESGPDHMKHFVVEVTFDGKCIGKGEGRSKKAAEQQAAYNALKKLTFDDNN